MDILGQVALYALAASVFFCIFFGMIFLGTMCIVSTIQIYRDFKSGKGIFS